MFAPFGVRANYIHSLKDISCHELVCVAKDKKLIEIIVEAISRYTKIKDVF